MSTLTIEPTIIGGERAPFIQNDDIVAIAEPLLTARSLSGTWLIECSFVSNEQIQMLNMQAQGKDETTDVLSFPVHFATNEADPHQVLPQDVPQTLGSIVVATDVAAKQADEHQQTVENEVRSLIEHGVHHLLGEDHDDQGTWLPRETHETFHSRDGAVQL